ncbi:zinc-dependent alcohol dehydrogenase [Halosegnis marinus]|uniref:Zinc-binding alcohol dehydrogenase n=1 Tax=Halosegnis marinus TaxID=3034023 RepID=A0ABD5ZJY8_9EURY|nr:zinc-binding alcohol dehydrogenase [Halosegnis sp. DT85]
MEARTLYFAEPGRVERRTRPLAAPDPGEVVVETTASGISAGSELLVYRGEVPDGMAVDATIDVLDGEFAYPLAYGYAAVGEVVAAGDGTSVGVGRRVFAFHPHADRFRTGEDAVVPLPDGVGTEAATLLPSVETATNIALDAAPKVGERAVVFGAGAVGLCTIAVLADFPLERLVAVEPVAARRERALALGADAAVSPEEFDGFPDATPAGADLAVELSGRPATLDDAIDAVGFDGRVVVGSWYGTKRSPVALGGCFHRDRISVESSQVSTVAPELRGRWTTDRRLDAALDRVARLDADRLLTHRVPFAEAEDAYRLLDEGADDALQVVLTYP